MNLVANKKSQKGVGMEDFFTEGGEKSRLEGIKKRARGLGVLGISFSNDSNELSASVADRCDSVLDIIEEDKEILDKNAGEFDGS